MTWLRDLRRGLVSEAGVTLMEMVIVCAIMAVVMVVSVPSVDAFYHESTAISRTYAVVDEVVPATETLGRYLREAVQPGPSVAPFVNNVTDVTNAWNAAFYTDTGNANGPELVVTQLTTVAGTDTFTMTMTQADAGSCPPAGSACTYTKSPTHSLLSVDKVINGGTPIFTYTLQGGSTTSTPSSAQLDEIVAVSVYIEAQLFPGNASGFQTMVYLLAPAYQTWVG